MLASTNILNFPSLPLLSYPMLCYAMVHSPFSTVLHWEAREKKEVGRYSENDLPTMIDDDFSLYRIRTVSSQNIALKNIPWNFAENIPENIAENISGNIPQRSISSENVSVIFG